MSRRLILVALLFTFTSGIAVGTYRWQGSSEVQANALERSEVNRLYQELDRDTGTLIEGGKVLAKVAHLTTPSVVHIQSTRVVRGRKLEETGSGVLMNSSNASGVYVVSNRHVVEGSRPQDIEIRLSAPDARVLKPKQVWMDRDTDVAVMKIDAPGLQPARWGDSDQLQIGHMVLAMGSPFGLSQSVTYGIISAKGRRSLRLGNGPDVLNQDFIQTDAAINPGNSGGPLIDMRGNVIGINTAIASNSGGNDGIGFSIPSNMARRVMEQLLKNGRVQRAYLGVKLDPNFDAETAARFRLDRARGARIVEVYAQTPAARANLKIDDIVLTFDGVKVEDENHLINLVSLTDISRTVTLEVLREGRRINVPVKLGDRTELEQRSSSTPVQPPRFEYTVDPMGFTVQSIDDDLSTQLGFESKPEGLLVTRISNELRSRSDLKLYDVIIEVARQPVKSGADLKAAMNQVDGPRVLVKCQRVSSSGIVEQCLIIIDREEASLDL